MGILNFFEAVFSAFSGIAIPAVHCNPRDCFVPRNDVGFPLPSGLKIIHFNSCKFQKHNQTL